MPLCWQQWKDFFPATTVRKFIRRNFQTGNVLCSENSLRRNICMAKFPTTKFSHSEVSIQLILFTAKLFYCEILYGGVSLGEISYGETSGNDCGVGVWIGDIFLDDFLSTSDSLLMRKRLNSCLCFSLDFCYREVVNFFSYNLVYK